MGPIIISVRNADFPGRRGRKGSLSRKIAGNIGEKRIGRGIISRDLPEIHGLGEARVWETPRFGRRHGLGKAAVEDLPQMLAGRNFPGLRLLAAGASGPGQ